MLLWSVDWLTLAGSEHDLLLDLASGIEHATVDDTASGTRSPGDRSWPNVYDLQVVAVTREADGVNAILLRDETGQDLPGWSPGAHIELILPSGRVRQYSLCGSPDDLRTFRIAVLREEEGRGGSAEIHGLPLVGMTLKVRGPRNQFEVQDSPSYLFIAGGIGITPILSMIGSMPEESDWSLYYLGRSRSTMAFVDEVVAIGGDRVHIVAKDDDGRLNLPPILDATDPETSVYCCGPPALLEAVAERIRSRSDGVTLAMERFAPAETRNPAPEEARNDSAFVVELDRSQVVLTIPADRSALSVIRESVPDVPYSCEEGYCGSCEARVLGGVPDHRDDILTEDERAANKTMFPCVSRARSPRIVLDL